MSKGFFNWIKADGSTKFRPEKDRYHMYVAMVCPFAGRCLTVRKLKGLEDVISVCVLDSNKPANDSWKFNPEKPGCDEDKVNGCKNLKEVYLKADPNYEGRFSVPLLWDKKTNTAVNNESIDIMRMFNSEFNAFCPTVEQKSLDLLPDDWKGQIEDLNSWITPNIVFGVYKAGRAENQAAYNENVKILFDSLDKVESLLSKHRYLVGDKITEADVRLFCCIARFEAAYYFRFKCNLKRIQDFPNLFGWLCDVYQTGNVRDVINFDEIKIGYFSDEIVPIGPTIDLMVSHNRDKEY